MRAAILGGGSFGTALAFLLGGKGEVRVWTREEDAAREIREGHTNARYLPGIRVPDTVTALTELAEALEGADLVVVATPSHTIREVIDAAAPHLPAGTPIVSAAKGIEEGTLLTPTEVMESVLPEHFHPYLGVLSGPSFAKEIVRGAPTAVTAAASWSRVARRVQETFSCPTFRCYTSSDVIGVQLGAALKNVMAIGAGIVDGLNFGQNARAALITRGLAEMTRLAVHRGGNPVTLYGLAGLGDLVLTCTGDLSRNRTVGLELGRGKKLPEILKALGQVAEGVKTARSAHDMARKEGVDAPITEQVHAILHHGKDPHLAVTELMTRHLKPEF